MSADNTPGLGRGNEGHVYQIKNGRGQFAPQATGLPFGTSVTDQTANRSFGNIYHNTSGKPLMLLISCDMASDLAAGAAASLWLNIDSVTPPLVTQMEAGFRSVAAAEEIVTGVIVGMVSAGYYYELVNHQDPLGDNYIHAWFEVQ